MTIEFKPAVFEGLVKTSSSTVSIKIDGLQLLYGGQPDYRIPGPTGSQHLRQELPEGPIIIQDHGSRLSFKELSIEPMPH